jgi:hypothetical protein
MIRKNEERDTDSHRASHMADSNVHDGNLERYLDTLADFLQALHLPEIHTLRREPMQDGTRLLILGGADDRLNIEAARGELTIEFGESHWHLAPDEDDASSTLLECTRDVMKILLGEWVTYSAWSDGRALGGGVKEDVQRILESCHKYFPSADHVVVKQFGMESETYSPRSTDP